MLTTFHKILIGLLFVQIALAALVLGRGDATAVQKEAPLLAGFDAAKVTRVQVFALAPDGSAPKTPTVDLVKRDTAWVVASGFDFPVDGTKVPDALTPIAKMAAAAPIATQPGRHKQLKVADDDYERKLVITMNGKDTTVFIGGSAGARRTAVRVAGEDQVYGVSGVNGFSFGDTARAWVAGRYLEVPHDDIAKVTIAHDGKTIELFKAVPAPAGSGSGSGSASTVAEWTATIDGQPITLAAGETLDLAAIDRAISSVSLLDLDAPADPKRDASHPSATITIERKASATATPAPVVLDLVADGTSYWVHDRSSPRAVLIGKPRLDTAATVDRAKLVKAPPPPPAKGAGSGASPPPQVPMDLPGMPMGD